MKSLLAQPGQGRRLRATRPIRLQPHDDDDDDNDRTFPFLISTLFLLFASSDYYYQHRSHTMPSPLNQRGTYCPGQGDMWFSLCFRAKIKAAAV